MDLGWIWPTAVGLITGLISFLTKRAIDQMDQKVTKVNERIDDLACKLEESDKELFKFKEKVANEYVKKGDYVTNSIEMNKKMDKIYDILLSLERRIKE